MRKKVVGAILLVLALSALLLWISRPYLVSKVGDLGPAMLPAASSGDLIQASAGPNSPTSINNGPFTLPAGFAVETYAKDLGQARDLVFSPGGTLLVSSMDQGKIYALPKKQEVLTGLKRPHGLAFFDGKLYVAEETQLVRYNWDEQSAKATLDKVLFSLPKGGRHFTRTLAFKPDGTLYVSVGSSCDNCQEKDDRLASVMISDKDGNNPRVFATGLRNSVFLAMNPKSNELWGTEMGRDFEGDHLPPDEINIIRDNETYGWPNCFGDRVFDTKGVSKDPSICDSTQPPIFEIPAHSAPLGLAFINSPQFPADWQGDLLVALHGSWNSSVPVGYKIIHLKVNGDTITSSEDFMTGFLKNNSAVARPVDLIFDQAGNLYISDDKAGMVYRVRKVN